MMSSKELLNSTVSIATEVGAFIRKERSRFSWDHVTYKAQNDMVSYVDKEAEKQLVEALSRLLPSAGFITEEKTTEQRDAEYRWIVDPLDGTTNFIHGIPCYSVSIALAKGKEIVLGVIYEVSRDESFSAYKGYGAQLNGESIQVSRRNSLRDSLFITGLPVSRFAQKENYLAIIPELMERTHGLRRLGSAATDLAYVACGRAEGFYECNLNPWDVAAGALIVQEAGGTVTDFKGSDDYLFGKEIVAGCAVQSDLLSIIQKHWNK